MSMVFSGIAQDIRYALRQLRRSPGFAVTAALTLALGIGATATMDSVVRDVLLSPLPYPDRDRLVGIAFTFPQQKPNAEEAGSSAEFIREHSQSFDSLGIAEDAISGANLSEAAADGHAMRVGALKVSQGYLSTLGLHPALGRGFSAEEDLPGGPKVAMLGFWVWQRNFGGDPGIINRVVRINEESFTVVGVLPREVSGTGDAEDAHSANAGVWLPLQLSPKDPGYEGDNYILVGRLRAGLTVAGAQTELDRLKTPFYEEHPGYKDWTIQKGIVHEFRVWPLRSVMVSEVRQSLLVLLSAVCAVLLVACLNLAGLMTARASTRQRELALRTALGATRWGLLRLLVSESLLLACAGAIGGLALSRVAKPILLASAPISVPSLQASSGTFGMAAFILVVTCITSVVCGLLPALTVFRQDAQSALKGGQNASINFTQARVGKALMVGQVSVAMVLLTAACLLLGTFVRMRSIPSGVITRRLEIAQVILKGQPYAQTQHTVQFIDKVIERLSSSPGVERAAAVNGLPLDRGLNIFGNPADRPQMKRIVEFRPITAGYLRTLGIPLLAGRDLSPEDGAKASPVALISETAARRYWPAKSPIGERFVVGGSDTFTIVGVVADTRSHSLAEAPQVMVYAPFAQLSDSMMKIVNGWFPTTIAIRLSGDVDMASAVEKAVSEADPEIPVAKLTTMQTLVDHNVAAPRFFSWMAAGFAVFALLLTVIGLFGLLSYQVTQRTREIGVRLAIGSTRHEILQLMMGRGMFLTTLGLALGILGSLAVPRIVGSILEDTVNTGGAPIASALSSGPAALTLAAVAMLLAAAAASFFPARRAAAVEPMDALRTE